MALHDSLNLEPNILYTLYVQKVGTIILNGRMYVTFSDLGI